MADSTAIDSASQAPASQAPAAKPRAVAPFLALIFFVLAADQASKYWVLEILNLPDAPGRQISVAPVFSLSYVENRGISFGLFHAGAAVQAYLLAGLSLAITALFAFWLARGKRLWQNVGLSLAIGGAIGNIIDRLRFHYVIDFLDFSQLYFPWVFNIADAGISVGAGLLLLDLLFQKDPPPRRGAMPAPMPEAREQDENASIKPTSSPGG